MTALFRVPKSAVAEEQELRLLMPPLFSVTMIGGRRAFGTGDGCVEQADARPELVLRL
jgi:hypothetical protein